MHTVEEWIDIMTADARSRIAAAVDACESPIEQLMLIALVRTALGVVLPRMLILAPHDGTEEQEQWAFEMVDGPATVLVAPQIRVMRGRYRLDLAVTYGVGEPSPVRVDVECDGHDYHERTPEQAERDKERDRELQVGGYVVARFTGREIYRDPEVAAGKVWDICRETYQRRKTV